MTTVAKNYTTSFRTRMLYSLSSFGIALPAESLGGIIAFYIVDVMNLPATWFATFWIFYTIYNALNNPLLGYLSDRTKSRWGRRIPYILFGSLPYVLVYAFIFWSPYDGKTNPYGLLLYFGLLIVIWEGLYTAVATGYYSLLPEMFPDYEERTDVAAKMNIFQIIALLVGVALPPIMAETIGWGWTALILAVLSGIAIYIGVPAMFEVKQEDTYFPLKAAFKATFINRSYLMASFSQTMRFFGTGVMQMGMLFYVKYSLNADPGTASLIFGVSFLLAAALLYPWKYWIANRLDSRRTLMIANAVMIVGMIPLFFATSLALALVAAAIIGVGLSGLVLIGDVIVAEVVDEDEVKTGVQRAGMYFGMTGLLITLGGLLVSSVFGILLPLFGYDTLLEVQPATVNLGFRVFITVPAVIGFLLAILALYFYPLHGSRLKEIHTELTKRADAKKLAAESE
jgi:glycoside/pentoside/hexuronide:cation symporter, GPH family